MLNKQSLAAHKGWFSNFWLGWGTASHYKNVHVVKCHNGPRNWIYYLVRSEQLRNDTKFRICKHSS
jgi:hypothetical protein